MRNIFLRTLLTTGLVVLLVQPLAANEQYWWSPGDVSSPGPRDNTPLILDKEHVRIGKKRVKAQFWVRNPTEEDIEVTMGFPIVFDPKGRLTHNAAGRSDEELYSEMSAEQKKKAYEKIARDYYGNIKVTQNGKKISTHMELDAHNKSYPLVFLWKATYPAGKTVHDVVTHPTIYERWSNSPNSREGKRFTYITHTGAYWAEPIGAARFEYCDEPAREFMRIGAAC